MSVAFVPKRHGGKAQINQETIQRLLDENDQLVRCITEYTQKGRAMECVHERSQRRFRWREGSHWQWTTPETATSAWNHSIGWKGCSSGTGKSLDWAWYCVECEQSAAMGPLAAKF
uniref:Ss18, like 2 n=1 Tax=Hucho hucho TaxID=62062 RepID=A0A4W5KI61_9TELE